MPTPANEPGRASDATRRPLGRVVIWSSSVGSWCWLALLHQLVSRDKIMVFRPAHHHNSRIESSTNLLQTLDSNRRQTLTPILSSPRQPKLPTRHPRRHPRRKLSQHNVPASLRSLPVQESSYVVARYPCDVLSERRAQQRIR